MSLRNLLNSICTIQRRTETQGGLGEVEKTWVNSFTNVPCQGQPNSEPIQLENGYTVTVKDFLFYFAPDQIILESHRIIWNGGIYQVRGVVANSRATYKKAYATLLDYNNIAYSQQVITLPMRYAIVGE